MEGKRDSRTIQGRKVPVLVTIATVDGMKNRIVLFFAMADSDIGNVFSGRPVNTPATSMPEYAIVISWKR